MGVDRLAHQQAAGAEPLARELEEAHERVGRQVLDDVDGRDRAERARLERLQVGDRVADRDVEPGRLGLGRHPGVGVDPGGLDPGAAERFEQLAAAAADVQHGRVARSSST